MTLLVSGPVGRAFTELERALAELKQTLALSPDSGRNEAARRDADAEQLSEVLARAAAAQLELLPGAELRRHRPDQWPPPELDPAAGSAGGELSRIPAPGADLGDQASGLGLLREYLCPRRVLVEFAGGSVIEFDRLELLAGSAHEVRLRAGGTTRFIELEAERIDEEVGELLPVAEQFLDALDRHTDWDVQFADGAELVLTIAGVPDLLISGPHEEAGGLVAAGGLPRVFWSCQRGCGYDRNDDERLVCEVCGRGRGD